MPEKIIRAIGLDCFKTSLLETTKSDSPYKHLISRLYLNQRGDVMTALRKKILTMHLPLDEVIFEAQKLNLFVENKAEMENVLVEAQRLLAKQLEPDSFERNPEFERLKHYADNSGIKTGIVSDLAFPYGALVDDKLDDVSTRIYSYYWGCIKEDLTPFDMLSGLLGVNRQEIVFVGDNIKSDYLSARYAGLQALWYVPDATGKNEYELKKYADDIVTSLDQIVPKMQERGFTL